MCRQNVVSSTPHNLSQSLPDVDPQHPQYQFICTQRRKIRKWKLHNQRTSNFPTLETVVSDTPSLSKKEVRRLKNRESAALSRKRKINEITEVQNLVLKLNQENIALRQRISMLEGFAQNSMLSQQNFYQPPSSLQPQQSGYQQLQAQSSQQNIFQQQNVYQQKSIYEGLKSIESLADGNSSPYLASSQFFSTKCAFTNLPRPLENDFPVLSDGQNFNKGSYQNQLQRNGQIFDTYPSIPYQNMHSTQFSQARR